MGAVIAFIDGDHGRLSDPLSDLALAVNALFTRADTNERKHKEQRIEAGCKLLEAQKMCKEAGENFGRWCKVMIKRKRSDIYKVMALARAPDPQAALEKEHKKQAEADKKRRKVSGSRDAPEVVEISAFEKWKADFKALSTADQRRGKIWIKNLGP